MSHIKKATVGIIGAMQIEVEALCAAMENTETETVGNMTFVLGDLRGKRVVCAKCGIGKVFAAMCAQTMILRYAPACIINSGVAGTLSETLSIGQIALAEQVVQHDMDTSPIGDPVGLISGINIIYIPTDRTVTAALAAAIATQRRGHTSLSLSQPGGTLSVEAKWNGKKVSSIRLGGRVKFLPEKCAEI